MLIEGYKLTPAGERYFKELKKLTEKEVRFGFFADTNRPAALRKSDGTIEDSPDVTILDVAMWNELGTVNSPPRPFMRMSIDENKAKINAFCANEARKISQGGTAEQALKSIGVFAKGLVQEKIKDGTFVPNAPSTIARKGSDKPLIDTGRMRQSVNFVIKDKGGR